MASCGHEACKAQEGRFSTVDDVPTHTHARNKYEYMCLSVLLAVCTGTSTCCAALCLSAHEFHTSYGGIVGLTELTSSWVGSRRSRRDTRDGITRWTHPGLVE